MALLAAHAADVTENLVANIAITKPAPAPKSIVVGDYLELEVNISGPLTLEKYSMVLLQGATPVSGRLVLAGPLLIDQSAMSVEHMGMNQLIVSFKAIAVKESKIIPPITLVATGAGLLSPLEAKTNVLPLDIVSYVKGTPGFQRKLFWRFREIGGYRILLIVGTVAGIVAVLTLIFYLLSALKALARRRRRKLPPHLAGLRDRLEEIQAIESPKDYAFAATAFLRELLELFEREPVHDKADREIVERLRRHSRTAPLAKRVQTILGDSLEVRYSNGEMKDEHRDQWGKSLEEICQILEKEHEESEKQTP